MSSVMSSESDFKSRYASVLDVTLRTALSETRSLYESMVEELQAEMCSVKKENEALWSKYNRLKKQRRIDTASQCDFLHQVPEEQEHLQRPEKTVESTLTLVALRSKDDEDRQSARLQHVNNTHADDVDCKASQPMSDDQVLSSNSSETDIVDSDESEDSQSSDEDLNTLKPLKLQNVKGRLPLRNKQSKDLEASTQTSLLNRTCTICRKRYKSTAGLKIHMRIHLIEQAYICSVCGKGWYRKGNLTKHMKQKHSAIKPHLVDKPFSCTLCDTSFKQSGLLRKHMTMHTVIFCKLCGKKYKYKAGLEMHMRIHTEKKPYSCTVCDRGFNQSEQLTAHMRIHTGEKPCVCTVCGRSFCQDKSLNRHMAVHRAKKCFSCIICNKTFYQSTELKEHMEIHTSTSTHEGQKPCSQPVDMFDDHSYAMAFPC